MTGPFIRIALRYAAALLVAKGVLAPGVGEMLGADPDVIMAIEVALGLAVAAISESWYAMARRMEWER